VTWFCIQKPCFTSGGTQYLQLCLSREHGLDDRAGREGDGDERVDQVGRLATPRVQRQPAECTRNQRSLLFPSLSHLLKLHMGRSVGSWGSRALDVINNRPSSQDVLARPTVNNRWMMHTQIKWCRIQSRGGPYPVSMFGGGP
jgi:hypothetical protein